MAPSSHKLAFRHFSAPYPITRCPQCIKEDDRVTEVVIAHWVAMIGNVVQMARDPHNSENVGNNISQILHGVAHVVREVTKRGGNSGFSPELLAALNQILADVPSSYFEA